tara:strand:- start:927 stop:1250 length:324 start_codon:yes stop_codon:yes gene_type:complete
MMIPTIINEVEEKVYSDGTHIKQYIVHAPEWDIYYDKLDGKARGDKIDHFMISESTRCGYLETLVFPCDAEGKCTKMIDVAGGRNRTADEILTSFALIMMEAGYDTI